MAYVYRVFTVVDEMLGKVLQLVPQLLWPLMWNTCTSLDVTLSGNLTQTIITSPFCFHLQVKEWKPWCYFGEKISKTDVFVSLTLEDSAPQCAVPTRQLDCPHRGSFTLWLPLCNDLVTGSLFYFPPLPCLLCQVAGSEPLLTGLVPE